MENGAVPPVIVAVEVPLAVVQIAAAAVAETASVPEVAVTVVDDELTHPFASVTVTV